MRFTRGETVELNQVGVDYLDERNAEFVLTCRFGTIDFSELVWDTHLFHNVEFYDVRFSGLPVGNDRPADRYFYAGLYVRHLNKIRQLT